LDDSEQCVRTLWSLQLFDPEQSVQCAATRGGDLERPRIHHAAYPPLLNAVPGDRGTELPSDVHTTFAPVQTRPAQDPGYVAARLPHAWELNASSAQEIDPQLSHKAGIVVELDGASPNEGLGDRHTQPAGEVVVTQARRPQGRIAQPHGDGRTRGAAVDASCMMVSTVCATSDVAIR
jgi:hypothetical protein